MHVLLNTPLQHIPIVVFGLSVGGAYQLWQRDCKHTSVLSLLAREVDGCGRVWGG
jgi:hypothetical protein